MQLMGHVFTQNGCEIFKEKLMRRLFCFASDVALSLLRAINFSNGAVQHPYIMHWNWYGEKPAYHSYTQDRYSGKMIFEMSPLLEVSLIFEN